MRNKIKLLLLSVITPLLCIGVSFGAGPIPGDLMSSVSVNYSDCQNLGYSANLGNFYSSNQISNTDFGCFYVHGPVDAIRGVQGSIYGNGFQGNLNLNFSYGAPLILCGDTTYLSSYLSIQLMVDCNPLQNGQYIDFDFYDLSNVGGSSSCESDLELCYSSYSTLQSNYNTLSGSYNICLNTLNDRNGQIGTLSGSLASCNSSLSSCESDLSACSNGCDTLVNQCEENLGICESNYSGCVITNASLQNYNDSLSSQLNECLSSGSGSIGGSGFVLNSFDIFWNDGEETYSLPITNNLFLPYGYKGVMSVDRVLSIARSNSLSTALQITDSDFNNKVVGSYSVVFLFFMSSGLFLVFIYVIRKYFIGLKN